MAKIKRRAVFGVDTDKLPVMTVDEFLYFHGKRFQRELHKQIALSKKIPSPSDQGNLSYLRNAVSVIQDLRVRNCKSITKPLKENNGDNTSISEASTESIRAICRSKDKRTEPNNSGPKSDTSKSSGRER